MKEQIRRGNTPLIPRTMFATLLLAFIALMPMQVQAAVTVSTLAGSGVWGFADGTGAAAKFSFPFGIAVDSAGIIYVADMNNHRIRTITSAGVVTTLAGSGVAGFADGTGTVAQFNNPKGIAVDSAGTVYVADTNNHRIRTITSAGVVTTLAGSGVAGFADGTGTAAQFTFPTGVAVDSAGTIYVADTNNHRIRTITPAGVVTTLAGSGVRGFADGIGTAAKFVFPTGIAVDNAGTIYVADMNNHRIRTITPAGMVTSLAGSGIAGFADGTGTAAQFNLPTDMAVDSAGTVYVADQFNHRIRTITPAGVVTTLAGSGVVGFADGTGTAAQFNFPRGIAVDNAGTVYVADFGNYRIRKIISGDSISPVVTAPSVDIYVSTVDGYGTPASNTLIVEFLGQASALDNVDGTLTPTNDAPVTFPIGLTMVTFTATDAAGNVGTATANVTVQALAATAINNIVNGATLTGTSQTFSWTDTGAEEYRLLVGSRFGGSGFFDSGNLAAGITSVTATGLPQKGVPIYVRLYAWVGGVWIKTDQTYMGASKPLATITTPANGVTLAATSQTFSWTDTGADKYFLMIGNFVVGGSDLYSSGVMPAGTTSVTVTGLPNDGSTIHARLYTWGNGVWQTSDTNYVAMPSTANVATPTNGSTLASPNQTFTWLDTGASQYYFIVGTRLGVGDIHQSGVLPAGTMSANVVGLPVGGVPIYVRLYSWGNGSWNVSNSTYTSAP